MTVLIAQQYLEFAAGIFAGSSPLANDRSWLSSRRQKSWTPRGEPFTA
ncbi:hypothetical protein [Hyphomicrobium sp. 1Nfss2.1]